MSEPNWEMRIWHINRHLLLLLLLSVFTIRFEGDFLTHPPLLVNILTLYDCRIDSWSSWRLGAVLGSVLYKKYGLCKAPERQRGPNNDVFSGSFATHSHGLTSPLPIWPRQFHELLQGIPNFGHGLRSQYRAINNQRRSSRILTKINNWITIEQWST